MFIGVNLKLPNLPKKTCEAKVSRHSELGSSGSSITFKRYVILALASHQPHVCRTNQGLRHPFRGVLEKQI